MQKIMPHLWFDQDAQEAAAFYVATFGDAAVTGSTTLDGTPSGSVDIVTVVLLGHEFMLFNAGPMFTFTPAISFMVACSTPAEVDDLWGKLSAGGLVMMELGEYPFSPRYGWCADRYGVSWQVMAMGDAPITQRITPCLLFVGEQCGKAEAAMKQYAATFKNANVGEVARYGEEAAPDKPGTVMFGPFVLEGQRFAAMDSAHQHEFTFSEAISLMVHCDDQAEIDHYWGKLSAVPEAEQCGWLKDAYGISWQIVPRAMNEMMAHGTKEQLARVTEAFLKMKKFDLAQLQAAYEGR